MSLRLLQAGQGSSRPLVAAFGPMAAAKLPRLLGPSACIVFDADGHGTESMGQIVDFAARQASFTAVSATALIGFSIGCSRVRGLRVGGAAAGAYLLVDGTHANKPPQPWQIAWIKDLADQARAGRLLLVASHTYQTYVEKMPKPYLASVTVLRLATGFALDNGGPATAPGVTKDPVHAPPTTGLWVYSYASAEADYEAHAYQGGAALHAMAARHLAPWLLQSAAPPQPASASAGPVLLVGDSLAVGLAAPLRTRIRAAGGELVGRGMNSTTIDDWAKGTALAQALAQTKPSRTLISLGTNDLAAWQAEHKRALTAAIVERIRAAGSAPAWILPPTMPIPDRGGTRLLLSEELARLAVPAFPSEALTLPRGGDGIHPTPAGYDLWAGYIAPWIASLSLAVPQATPPTWGTPRPPTRPAAPEPPDASETANQGPGPLIVLGALAAALGS